MSIPARSTAALKRTYVLISFIEGVDQSDCTPNHAAEIRQPILFDFRLKKARKHRFIRYLSFIL